ncbi:uncharacterized protein LOC144146872 [Haemaphysalis longicornis]
MAPHLLSSLACLLLAASANAYYVCSDFTGSQCSASTVFTLYKRGYLLASTGYAPHLAPPTHVTRISRLGRSYIRLLLQTPNGADTCTVGLTSRPDHFVLRYDSDPHTIHALRVPFADYSNCYVAQFDDDRFGCRLWVQENASPSGVSRCLQGLARVCPGPLYTTWNGQCVRGCSSNRWQRLPWFSVQQQQQQQQQQQLVL